jgi:hypothetical protein
VEVVVVVQAVVLGSANLASPQVVARTRANLVSGPPKLASSSAHDTNLLMVLGHESFKPSKNMVGQYLQKTKIYLLLQCVKKTTFSNN